MALEILTADEVARLMRVSRDTVYGLAACGELPGRRIGRIWRFPKDAVENYVRGRGARTPGLRRNAESNQSATVENSGPS